MENIKYLLENAALIWIVIAVIFGIIEGVTLGLTTIWFCIGALVSSVLAILGFGIEVQIGAFIVVSIGLLYFTRPILKEKLKLGKEKTNVDALIGEKGTVIRKIEPLEAGQIKIQGKEWSSIGADNQVFEVGEKVVVVGIQGVKLVVSKEII